MWYRLLTLTAILMLLMSKGIRGTDWIDYDEPPSNMDTAFDDDSDQYLSALTRDEEQEIHSPYITGYKYVSGMFFFSNQKFIIRIIYILI
jgi:hypothetical protein